MLTPEQAELQARARAFVEEVLMPLDRARGEIWDAVAGELGLP